VERTSFRLFLPLSGNPDLTSFLEDYPRGREFLLVAESKGRGGKTNRILSHLRSLSDLLIFAPLLWVVSVFFFLFLPERFFKGSLANFLLESLERVIKRGLDLALSMIGLLFSFPLLFFVALLIKIDSEGSIFYKQLRVGQNRRNGDRRGIPLKVEKNKRNGDRRKHNWGGEPFILYKFRTMWMNAEDNCGPVWAGKDDQRITRVGKFLRKSRLDEIPQLWNVLKGEMSIVGPRPERPFFVTQFKNRISNYSERFKTKPGITGLAQVKYKYDSSVEDVIKKLQYDLSYVNKWNILLDLKILLETIPVMLTGRGAH